MVIFSILLIFVITAWLTAAEMATFSARPERMRQAAESNDKRGTLVLVYQRSPVSFLAAGQVIATAASLTLGAIMQTEVTPTIEKWLSSKFILNNSEIATLASLTSLTIFTILALIITNVVPKQMGFDHADRIAILVSRPFRFLITITRPIAWLVTKASRFAEAVINRKLNAGHRVTEKDINTLIAEGLRIGTLDPTEASFVRNALNLSDISAGEIATPINEADYLLTNQNRTETNAKILAANHSYIPVFASFPTEPLGMLKARTWFAQPTEMQLLGDLIEPVIIIDHNESAVQVFSALSEMSSRVILVRRDKDIVGMLTLNDAVRLLAGNLKALD